MTELELIAVKCLVSDVDSLLVDLFIAELLPLEHSQEEVGVLLSKLDSATELLSNDDNFVDNGI